VDLDALYLTSRTSLLLGISLMLSHIRGDHSTQHELDHSHSIGRFCLLARDLIKYATNRASESTDFATNRPVSLSA
jgi:hypothetical protein